MVDLAALPQGQKIVVEDGTPSLAFALFIQLLIEQLEEVLTSVTDQVTDLAEFQALAEANAQEIARINSYPSPSSVLTATDAGTDASIIIANHTRIYPVGGVLNVPDVSIIGATLTGMAFATTYYVYYDDTTLEDTTPLFTATASLGTASVGAQAGRHFLGKIITPADGAGNTTGTGPSPPGGGGGDFLS